MATEATEEELLEQEDGEEVEKVEKLNPELLSACMRNDTETVMKLIESAADPCCEDQRQWSPLIWAASHGNETLTRLLIQQGATEVYKYDDSQGKVKKKKHSPLHWAAFKDQKKVLWLLLGQNLSPHEKDQIGNTALHQAAAGGSLECAKCLMAQGADVFSRNNRGHTPYALCTAPEVQNLLQRAMDTVACKATGKQFSSTVLRYLCSWSLEVFCETAVTQMYVYESPEAEEKEQPVTWCTEVKNMINEAERQLESAMHLNNLETITQALAAAEDKPLNCKLVHKCQQLKAKLESEISLTEAMQVDAVTDLESFTEVHETLSRAIEEALAKNADPQRVQAAKALRRKLMAEASLMRSLTGQQKTTEGHLTMLAELIEAARAESGNEELLHAATRVVARLTSEREVQQRLIDCAPLCELQSMKEAAGKENLPPWCHSTDKFEDFHEDYKRIVEQAESHEISKSLLASAVEQLSRIELLLVERKQAEAELNLKASKKKKR
mmetsp:Transcript_53797/g.125766  ORF Transcript_53797/g.125766 Transcript_53797/m.125766 type:complete len:498 (+) Transcript_53797:57-1550(+)